MCVTSANSHLTLRGSSAPLVPAHFTDEDTEAQRLRRVIELGFKPRPRDFGLLTPCTTLSSSAEGPLRSREGM